MPGPSEHTSSPLRGHSDLGFSFLANNQIVATIVYIQEAEVSKSSDLSKITLQDRSRLTLSSRGTPDKVGPPTWLRSSTGRAAGMETARTPFSCTGLLGAVEVGTVLILSPHPGAGVGKEV